MNTDTMGVYGNYYLKRAIVAQVGLGANLPEDAIYPLNLGDNTGQPLNGANKYTLHFGRDNLPPSAAFWSVTLLRHRRLPDREPLEPVCRQQLDAIRLQYGRLARSLFSEQKSRRRQGS